MYSQTELDQLIAAMAATGTTTLAVKASGKKLRLTLPAGAAPRPEPAPTPVAKITSPGIGLFRPCGMDDGLAALQPQAAIRPGEILGYVAQGAVLIAIRAPSAGWLAAPLPEPGQTCGHGDFLFTLEATS